MCSDPRSFSNPECTWNPFSTYVSVSRPRCSFALIYRKSGIVSIIFQVPSDQASGVVEFYFQSSVLSLSHPSRVDVSMLIGDCRLPPHRSHFIYNLMDQELRRNKDRSMIFEVFHLERNVLVIVQFMHSRKLDPTRYIRFRGVT